VAPQAALFHPAIGEVRPAVRAVTVNQAIRAALVLVEDEILAHQPDGLGWIFVELAGRGYGHPGATQQVAHGGSGRGLEKEPVLVFAQHGSTASGRTPSPRPCRQEYGTRARSRPTPSRA